MQQVFIVGFGYVAIRLLRQEALQSAFNQPNDVPQILALARGPKSVLKQQACGVLSLPGDLDRAGSLQIPSLSACGVFYFAPPGAEGVDDARMNNFLRAIADNPPVKIVYISTTGVYGDCQGARVTEVRPPNPGNARSRRRLAAEQALRAFELTTGTPVVVLRVPGIYGPGRLPEASIRSGKPIVRRQEAPFSNRIHVDDLVQICWAAMARAESGSLYNVSDGQDDTLSAFFIQVAAHLGLPQPPQISLAEAEQQLSPAMLSYLRESRRIDNHRVLRELSVTLHYPTLQQGLKSCS